MADLLIPRRSENSDELASLLESLPSYENLVQSSAESIFSDDEQEPSAGLINLIRKNSQTEKTPIDSSDTVRLKF